MARSLHQLTCLLACAAFATQALAEPTGTPDKKRRKEIDRTPEFENVRKALDALTPEQRKRFQENFWRWANLSPEEKKALRDREEVRKKFMEQEVQGALKEAGLQLDGERREQFIKRYGEERRKIEEQLRKETAEKRKPMVKEVIAQLKAEFSRTAPAAGEPAFAPAAPEKP
jgi:phosphoribosylaminoimidazole carboxylase (NCAIR synthetase)